VRGTKNSRQTRASSQFDLALPVFPREPVCKSFPLFGRRVCAPVDMVTNLMHQDVVEIKGCASVRIGILRRQHRVEEDACLPIMAPETKCTVGALKLLRTTPQPGLDLFRSARAQETGRRLELDDFGKLRTCGNSIVESFVRSLCLQPPRAVLGPVRKPVTGLRIRSSS